MTSTAQSGGEAGRLATTPQHPVLTFIALAVIVAIAAVFDQRGPGVIALGLFVLVAGIGALIIIARPRIALYGVLATAPLIAYRQELLGINMTAQRLFLLLGLTGVIAYLALGGRVVRLRGAAPLVLGAAYALYKAVDGFRSAKPELALRFVTILVFGLAVMLLLSLLVSNATMLRRALFVTLIGSLVPVLIGVTQVIGVLRGQLPTLPFHSYFAPREADDPRLGVAVAFTTGDWGSAVRPAGTLGGPVAFGEYAGLVMVLLAGLLITGAATRSGWRSATRVTYAVLLTAIVVGTFSRSAWIITLFGLGVVFLAARSAGAVRVSRTGAWLAASLLVVVVASSIAIVVAMFPGAVSSNLFSLFESGGRLGEHLDLRRAAVQLWLDNPLLGVGIGNYGALTGQGGLVSSAHATFVTELAEGGLVGVALLGGFCAATIRSAWRGLVNARAHRDIYPWALGLFAATVALVLNNIALYDTLFRDTSWVFLGLASVAGAVTAPPSR